MASTRKQVRCTPAAGSLELAGRAPAFQRSTGIFVYINDVSRIRAYSGRAPPNDRGQLRTLPRRDQGGNGLGTLPPAQSWPENIKFATRVPLGSGSGKHMPQPGIWRGRHCRSRGRDLESRVVKLEEKLQKPATPLLPIN